MGNYDDGAFFNAIEQGDARQVKSMLAAAPELVYARNEFGESALFTSMQSGIGAVSSALKKAGAVLDLFEAAAAGENARVRLLLTEDSQRIHAFSVNGLTPLHCAASSGYSDTLDILLQYGADVNARSRTSAERSPLHLAIINREADIVHQLIMAGADVNQRDGDGMTPLHLAARSGQTKLMTVLRNAGADRFALTRGKTAGDIANEMGFLADKTAAAEVPTDEEANDQYASDEAGFYHSPE